MTLQSEGLIFLQTLQHAWRFIRILREILFFLTLTHTYMTLPEIMWMKHSSWERLNPRKTWHVWCAEVTWCNNDLVKHFHILLHFGLDISDINSKHLAFLVKLNPPHGMVKRDGFNHIEFFTPGFKKGQIRVLLSIQSTDKKFQYDIKLLITKSST